MKTCYENYAKTAVFSHLSEAKALDLATLNLHYYLKHLSLDKTASILEVGCGQGRFLKSLRDRGYSHLYGIDLSADQIAYAQEKLDLKNYVELIDASSFLKKSASAVYDAIFLLDVLEHIPTEESIELLKECRRVLRPGGKLLIQVPNALAPLAPNAQGDITHYRAYTVYSMRQSLLLGGFTAISCLPIPPLVHGIKSFIRRLLWTGFINLLIQFYMLIASGTRMGGVFTPNLLAIAIKEAP